MSKYILTRDNELMHWKYVRREKVNGKWRYYYDDDAAKADRKSLLSGKLDKKINSTRERTLNSSVMALKFSNLKQAAAEKSSRGIVAVANILSDKFNKKSVDNAKDTETVIQTTKQPTSDKQSTSKSTLTRTEKPAGTLAVSRQLIDKRTKTVTEKPTGTLAVSRRLIDKRTQPQTEKPVGTLMVSRRFIIKKKKKTRGYTK